MTCAKQKTTAIVVNGGNAWVGTNECDNPQEVCPKIGMKTGKGYLICKKVCGQKNHAEASACIKAGQGARGATLYLIGHYYACDSCKSIMDEYGIKEVKILKETQ